MSLPEPEEAPEIKEVLHSACPKCQGRLEFQANTQNVTCAHCGYTSSLNVLRSQVLEKDFNEALTYATGWNPSQVGKKTFACKGCGAKALVTADQVLLTCAFCGAQALNLEADDDRLVQPFGLITFRQTKVQAEEIYRQWIGKGFFTPAKLKSKALLEKMRGLYIPFWTYDADTYSEYSGEAGYYYYVTVEQTDGSGNRTTRQERRTRWEYHTGTYEHTFDDILVSGSVGVPQEAVEAIFPYQLSEAINYTNEALYGWETEVYTLDVKQSFHTAASQMDAAIRQGCIQALGGDTYRGLQISTQKSNVTFKHLLLPLYILLYTYNGKTYTAYINGQTGRISGSKPVSGWKVALVVLAVILAAIVLWVLFAKN